MIGIGTKYISRGKRKNVCTVIDILTTYNSKSEVVSVKYLCEHDFMGQTVRHEELSTTIMIALSQNGEI